MTKYKHILSCSKCGDESAAFINDENKPIASIYETGCHNCGGIQKYKYVRTEKQ